MGRVARRPTAVLAVVATLAAVVWSGVEPAAAQSPPGPPYIRPVDAPVVDPFRPPSSPYGAGNRGIEYATTPGTPVVAAGDGEVVFAGSVGGSLHVTVLHGDGVRTSYSFLGSLAVRRGQRVAQGDRLGTAGARFHLGARIGSAYIDPADLFGGPLTVHLVPVPGRQLPGATTVAIERAAFAQLVDGLAGATGRGLSGGVAWARRAASGAGAAAGRGAADRMAAMAPAAARALGSAALGFLRAQVEATARRAALMAHYGPELLPPVHIARLAGAMSRWSATRGRCTPATVVPGVPRRRRIAVLVGGLGSTSDHAAVDEVDAAGLGYAPGDVIRFSYRGGRVPDAVDEVGGVAATSYASGDTTVDLRISGRRLAELLRAVAAAQPGTPVDVLAHSQGGVVARLALEELAAAGEPVPVDLVVTMGAPHHGADLATALSGVTARPGATAALRSLTGAVGVSLDPGAPAVDQLSETSAVARLGRQAVPAGARVLSIASRGDLTVPAGRSRLAGAGHAVLALSGADAHDRLPAAEATTREVRLALAGRPPTCESAADALADALQADLIAWSEDLIGFGATLASGAGPG